MKIILIRHGQTDSNADKTKIVGASPNMPLNENGILQAQNLGKYLAKKIDGNEIWFSSPFVRAQQTLENIFIGLEKKYNFELDTRLQEFSQGSREGQDRNEIYTLEQTNKMNLLKPWFQAPDGGESMVDIYLRAGNFLQEILRKYGDSDKTIICVSHSVLIRGAICFMMQIGAKNVSSLNVDNCSMSEFEFGKKGFSLNYLNKNIQEFFS